MPPPVRSSRMTKMSTTGDDSGSESKSRSQSRSQERASHRHLTRKSTASTDSSSTTSIKLRITNSNSNNKNGSVCRGCPPSTATANRGKKSTQQKRGKRNRTKRSAAHSGAPLQSTAREPGKPSHADAAMGESDSNGRRHSHRTRPTHHDASHSKSASKGGKSKDQATANDQDNDAAGRSNSLTVATTQPSSNGNGRDGKNTSGLRSKSSSSDTKRQKVPHNSKDDGGLVDRSNKQIDRSEIPSDLTDSAESHRENTQPSLAKKSKMKSPRAKKGSTSKSSAASKLDAKKGKATTNKRKKTRKQKKQRKKVSNTSKKAKFSTSFVHSEAQLIPLQTIEETSETGSSLCDGDGIISTDARELQPAVIRESSKVADILNAPAHSPPIEIRPPIATHCASIHESLRATPSACAAKHASQTTTATNGRSKKSKRKPATKTKTSRGGQPKRKNAGSTNAQHATNNQSSSKDATRTKAGKTRTRRKAANSTNVREDGQKKEGIEGIDQSDFNMQSTQTSQPRPESGPKTTKTSSTKSTSSETKIQMRPTATTTTTKKKKKQKKQIDSNESKSKKNAAKTSSATSKSKKATKTQKTGKRLSVASERSVASNQRQEPQMQHHYGQEHSAHRGAESGQSSRPILTTTKTQPQNSVNSSKPQQLHLCEYGAEDRDDDDQSTKAESVTQRTSTSTFLGMNTDRPIEQACDEDIAADAAATRGRSMMHGAQDERCDDRSKHSGTTAAMRTPRTVAVDGMADSEKHHCDAHRSQSQSHRKSWFDLIRLGKPANQRPSCGSTATSATGNTSSDHMHQQQDWFVRSRSELTEAQDSDARARMMEMTFFDTYPDSYYNILESGQEVELM